MKSLAKFVMSAAAIAVLAGCSTLSKEQCEMGDWHEIGRMDGSKGYEMARFQQHVKACGEYGVTPSREVYTKGRDVGLTTYCTPENGMTVGRNGSAYKNVCPANLERLFLKKYKIGKEMYDIDSQIKQIDYDIESIDGQFDNAKLSSSDRSRLRSDQRRLEREKDRLQKRLTMIEMKEMVTETIQEKN
ncbi:MAG: DUF2799 domain-containing protein [Bdellovibrionaceae bacterium]|nr:DUF2799 domain-containing protein [Bdellovibrionales bacterium]MCB9084633.1 DUF2799 domain-containing protein [Pseudobdellovibrionaceae bacterium]